MSDTLTEPPIAIRPEDWALTPASVQKQISLLVERIRQLEGEVAELRARVNTNSSNSSVPPSKDPPWAKPTRRQRQAQGVDAAGSWAIKHI